VTEGGGAAVLADGNSDADGADQPFSIQSVSYVYAVARARRFRSPPNSCGQSR